MSEQKSRFATIHMVGHAHLDPVWLWRWTEGYQEARATLAAAVALLEEFEDYVFTFEQVAVVDWIRESDPKLFARLRELVACGRIAMVGGWWVEPDCNLPNLESFVRQGLIGQRYLLEHFGGIANVGLNADPFGHSAALPQVLAGHRIASYCFLRPGPHEIDMPHTLFEWQGLGGASVAAYRIPHEYCTTAEDVDRHMESAISKIGAALEDEAMVFYGVGNHGGGPTRRNLKSIEALNADGRFGKLIMSGPDRYFEARRKNGKPMPVHEGELQRHAAGCYAAFAKIKQMNLKAEAALLEAERYATLSAATQGVPYPREKLDEAWKTLLFNQFHDILPGSSILPACEDAVHALGGVIATADRVTNRALQIAARDIAIPADEETQPVIVFNPHPFEAEITAELELSFLPGNWIVSAEDGEETPWQKIRADATIREEDIFRDRYRARIAFPARVPAFGHRLYRVRRTDAPQAIPQVQARAHGITIENAHLRVTINPQTGWLDEFVTLANGQDLAPAKGAIHTVVSADGSDTWGHRVETYVGQGRQFEVESIHIEDAGPVRAAIRVNVRLGRSRLTELFVLDSDARSLEIRTEIDWHEELHLLKLRYPTAISASTARYQMQYGYVERPADGLEYPGQRWVSVAGSDGKRISVINNAKYAYDCVDGDIGITAARSPVFAWHDPRELRDNEHYHYQDQGLQRFSVRLLPQTGDDMAEANRLAEMMVMPPRVMMESFHPGDMPAARGLISGLEEAPGLRLTALKPWEDDPAATVMRFVNDTSGPIAARLGLDYAGGHLLSLDLEPFEIRTLAVTPSGKIVTLDLLEFEPDRQLNLLSEGI
ncbi:alpha-mannosidase [Martelella mediterranea]|uniref:Alpha-mannosidase n=1 Tax=Martelella mediterranea TaxID=293089 RepID=A0A4R3NW34_9HYPH|nr:alpha-mannosidase [Martelella mediterranea]TCT41994.1 alpha-mannosidase [Martelella mediterranea]